MPESTPAPKTRWIAPPRSPEREERLGRELGLSPLASAVMAARGFDDPAAAEKFLNPRLEDLHDPRLLPDYEPAVKAILGAKDRKETIYVHGDYDVDGVTSAALFTRFLRKIGCTIVPHVPHRLKEGYGIHPAAVGWAKEHGAALFLTCDCGISAHDQIDMVVEAGMRAVVTDHHGLKETLPNAEAVINPHRSDSQYPFSELCGAGVVFKLCAGLAEELGYKRDQFYRAYLDLAVLGTVADVMPLVDENRIIARHGLPQLKQSRKAGVQALLAVAGLDKPGQHLNARHIGFQIAPRINAVGRIDDAGHALELLLTDDDGLAARTALMMDELNQERRNETSRMQEEAIELIDSLGLSDDLVVVVSSAQWHPGIIGLVASKLVERCWRPAFVIGVGEDGRGKGSARSIPGFHLGEALRFAEDLILGGGGHEMAAGFSIEEGRIDDFRRRLIQRAEEVLPPEALVPSLFADLEVEAHEALAQPSEALALLEPFGEANPQPLFISRGLSLGKVSPLKSPEHARAMLMKDGLEIPAIAFGIGQVLANLPRGAKVDVAFRPEFNTFRGATEFRWTLVDVQESA